MEEIVKIKTPQGSLFEKWAGKECNTCGDAGFNEELLRCTTGQARYQHTIMYANLVVDQWRSHVPSTIAVKHPRIRFKTKSMHSIKSQWSKSSDTLELLLAVAQSVLSKKVAEDGGLDKQKAIQQQALGKQSSSLKEKRKVGVNELSQLSRNQLRLTSSRKGVARRYKLLSDVYG